MNRIDFTGIISAIRCNPNGDPINAGRPREDFEGHGFITDVCLKRKLRDRMEEYGYNIFVSSKISANLSSMKDKINEDKELKQLMKNKDLETFNQFACKKWFDVRAFGQVFAFKDTSGNVSTSVRGSVSVGTAYSLEPIDIVDLQITKSLNTNTVTKNIYEKDRSTMGMKYIIEKGVYVFHGGIFPQLAEKTGFSEDDAEKIKHALIHLFDNDSSASRPMGSMALEKLFWWKHNSKIGQYSPARVHRSLKIEPIETAPYYETHLERLPDLDVEIISGW